MSLNSFGVIYHLALIHLDMAATPLKWLSFFHLKKCTAPCSNQEKKKKNLVTYVLKEDPTQLQNNYI